MRNIVFPKREEIQPRFNGDKIREARELHNLSVTRLKTITGISRQSLTAYEANRQIPKFKTLQLLARALSVKVGFFFLPSAKDTNACWCCRINDRSSSRRVLSYEANLLITLQAQKQRGRTNP